MPAWLMAQTASTRQCCFGTRPPIPVRSASVFAPECTASLDYEAITFHASETSSTCAASPPHSLVPCHAGAAITLHSSAPCHAPVQERLEREYDLDLIVTAPSVVYEVELNDGTKELVDSPAKLVSQHTPHAAMPRPGTLNLASFP